MHRRNAEDTASRELFHSPFAKYRVPFLVCTLSVSHVISTKEIEKTRGCFSCAERRISSKFVLHPTKKEKKKKRNVETEARKEGCGILRFVSPRTSVNKRRNIFLTRSPSRSIAANQVFKYLSTKIYVEGTMHELCIRRVHHRCVVSLSSLFRSPALSLSSLSLHVLRFFLLCDPWLPSSMPHELLSASLPRAQAHT